MFQENILLSKYSNYQIGGGARFFYVAKSADQITEALSKWRKEEIRMCRSHKVLPGHSHMFILGGGTNLLISDEGFNGLVLKPEINKLQASGVTVQVGAGVSMSQLLNYSITKSLSGLEWAGGLPGTVGGAIRGNAGAFAGEIKDCVKEVVSFDISGKKPKIVKRNNTECQFGYRNSVFKMRDNSMEVEPQYGGSTSIEWAGPAEIILEVTLALKKGDRKAIRQAIEEKIKYRQERQPLNYPNIGSIFKNVSLARIIADLNADITQISKDAIRVSPRRNQRRSAFIAPLKTDPFPVVPTAHLISQTGLKGVSYGGAMISPKHPNFIVNVLNAKASDVKSLIYLAKSSVKEKFGIELEEEIQYVK